MVDIQFKYENQKRIINCELNEKIIDACKKFATQINIDLFTKIIIFNDEKIDLNSDFTFYEQIDTSSNPDKFQGKYKIKLIDDNEKLYKVVLDYQNKKNVIKLRRGDKIKKVFEKIKKKANSYFLFSGNIVDDKILESRFSQVANKIDKENKLINLVGYDNDDEDEEIKEEVKDNIKTEENNNQNAANNEVIPNTNNNINENNSNLNENRSNEIRNDNNLLNIDEDLLKRNIAFKSLLMLIIQFIIIIIFVWLGCSSDINEGFTKSLGAMLGTFIPTIIVYIIFFAFYYHIILNLVIYWVYYLFFYLI